MDIIKNIIRFLFQQLISIRLLNFLLYPFLANTKHYFISDTTNWNKKNVISLGVNKLARLNHPKPVLKNIIIHDERPIKLILDITQFTSCDYYLGIISVPLLKLITFIKRGTFIDIGANIGFYSLIASNYFDHVFSFEPVSFNHKKLIININHNNIKNITPIKKALGEKQEEMMMFLNPQNDGGNSLLDKKGKSWRISNLTERVTVDTLDKVANFKNVSLIKIDVEGFEEFVIKGGKKLLNKQKPTIFLEVNNDMKRAQRILDFCPKDYVFFNSLGANVIDNDMIYCHKNKHTFIKNLLLNKE